MKNIHTQRETLPSQIDGTYPPTREQLLAAGWRYVPPQPEIADGYTRVSCTFAEGDGVTGVWQVVDRPTSEIEAEAAGVERARILLLASQYGGLVAALAAYLERVGWGIPCEPGLVTGDLLQRDLTGQLNADQKEAKANLADTYMMLTAVGVSNEDIAKIWEVIRQ